MKKWDSGTLKVAEAGIAARLRIERRTVHCCYHPSTQAGMPSGIEDDTCALRVTISPLPHDPTGYIGCYIAQQCHPEIGFSMDKAAELLGPTIERCRRTKSLTARSRA